MQQQKAQVINRKNISVVVGQYPDKNNPQLMKNKWRTIGEIVTLQNPDGSISEFGELWGPHGATKFNLYEQEDRNQSQVQDQHNTVASQPHAAPAAAHGLAQPQPAYQQSPPQGQPASGQPAPHSYAQQ